MLKAKIAELKVSNPLGVDIAQLEKLKVECVISSGADDANRHPHLKRLTDSTDNDKVKESFKLEFSNGGDVGIVIVSDMLLTGFDAPVEQVLYLDKKLANHNLLQAIARVNRVCGADKKCGYVVDYVGITHHLKEAQDTVNSITGVESFIDGFRLGTKIGIEIMSKDDGCFVDIV